MSIKHFLTGEELPRPELAALLQEAESLKADRKAGKLSQPLQGRTLITLFEKPSLRTRVSFTVAMQELGGSVVESTLSTRKHEEPEDLARVLGGYAHAIMCRTHAHANLDRMASRSPVPVINGLSDTHHPCQGLADLLTLKQVFGELKGLQLCYLGDGNNVLHSLLLLAPYLGVSVRYACPEGREPSAFIVKVAQRRAREGGATISAFSDPAPAAKGANALYTDTWTSMGFETTPEEQAEAEKPFERFQLNEELHATAASGAIVMHCMPMVRGREITDAMVDHPQASAIFRQSENRLHVQKALLLRCMSEAGSARGSAGMSGGTAR
jgi:ornithine carbamoyltransferase